MREILNVPILCIILSAAVMVWSFPSDAMDDISGQMPLRGEGIKRVLWKNVLKVRLYAPTQVMSSAILEAHPKCLQVEYYVSISRQKLTGYISNKMFDNAGQLSLDVLQPGLQEMSAILPDIHPGDSLTMCYDPSAGTDFIHNNLSRGVVAGDDFAAVIFATWLGSHPVDSRLKRDLLGNGSYL